MNLSSAARVGKLLGHLLSHPGNLWPYCQHHPFWKKLPVDYQLPWWSFGAIEALRRYCRPAHAAFEFGTGGSTLFLARRCRSVTAVEDDGAWLDVMREHLERQKASNVQLCHEAFDFQNPKGFEDSSYSHALSGPFDIIVVDGQDISFRERPTCFARAESFVNPGGVIVVDDSWRYAELRSTKKAKRVEVHEGVGPCRVGVTSTDVFYY